MQAHWRVASSPSSYSVPVRSPMQFLSAGSQVDLDDRHHDEYEKNEPVQPFAFTGLQYQAGHE